MKKSSLSGNSISEGIINSTDMDMDMDMEMEMMYDAMTSSGNNIIPKDIDREDGISLLYLVNKIRHQTGLYRNTSYTLSKCVKSLITYYKTTSSSSSTSTLNEGEGEGGKGKISKLVLGPMPGTTTYDTRLPELPSCIDRFQELVSLELNGFRQIPKELIYTTTTTTNTNVNVNVTAVTTTTCGMPKLESIYFNQGNVPSLFFNFPTMPTTLTPKPTTMNDNDNDIDNVTTSSSSSSCSCLLKCLKIDYNDILKYKQISDFITKKLPTLEKLVLMGYDGRSEKDVQTLLGVLKNGNKNRNDNNNSGCSFRDSLKILKFESMGINEIQFKDIFFNVVPIYTKLTDLSLRRNKIGSLQILVQEQQQQQHYQSDCGLLHGSLRTINLSHNPIVNQIRKNRSNNTIGGGNGEHVFPKEEKKAFLHLLNTYTGISNIFLFDDDNDSDDDTNFDECDDLNDGFRIIPYHRRSRHYHNHNRNPRQRNLLNNQNRDRDRRHLNRHRHRNQNVPQQQQALMMTLDNNNNINNGAVVLDGDIFFDPLEVEVEHGNNDNDNWEDNDNNNNDNDDDDDMHLVLSMFPNMFRPNCRSRRFAVDDDDDNDNVRRIQNQNNNQNEALYDSDIEYLMRINHAGRKFTTPSPSQPYYARTGVVGKIEVEGSIEKLQVEESKEEILPILTNEIDTDCDDIPTVDGECKHREKDGSNDNNDSAPSSSPSLPSRINENNNKNMIKPQLWPFILERAYNKSNEITTYDINVNNNNVYNHHDNDNDITIRKKKCATGMHYMIRNGSVLHDIITAHQTSQQQQQQQQQQQE